MTFRIGLRVYYEDTDAGGVVYHANMVKFMERARTEMLIGFGHGKTFSPGGGGGLFVVKTLALDYKAPGYLGDELTVTCAVKRLGGSSITLTQNVYCHEKLLVSGEVVIVLINEDGFRPQRLPAALREAFGKHLEDE